MHLVMLETNGNQRFIFSSPRLRDSVGASSLLTKLREWTERGLVSTGAAATWCTARGLPSDGRSPHDSQWVSTSSGKVIFLVDSAQQAKDVIGAVTRKVLAEAPGMDVSGVFIRLPAPSDSQPGPVYVTESALKEIHAEAARYALQLACRGALLPASLPQPGQGLLPARIPTAGHPGRGQGRSPGRAVADLARPTLPGVPGTTRSPGDGGQAQFRPLRQTSTAHPRPDNAGQEAPPGVRRWHRAGGR